eukprot:3146315-Prymnesium_polylepis.1
MAPSFEDAEAARKAEAAAAAAAREAAGQASTAAPVGQGDVAAEVAQCASGAPSARAPVTSAPGLASAPDDGTPGTWLGKMLKSLWGEEPPLSAAATPSEASAVLAAAPEVVAASRPTTVAQLPLQMPVPDPKPLSAPGELRSPSTP